VTFELYIDDSGSRQPDHRPSNPGERDAFGLGGILLAEEDAAELKAMRQQVTDAFEISVPLHSHTIRNKAHGFRWLGSDSERARLFYDALNNLFADMPAYATGCIIHRPGYNARYRDIYQSNRWHLCKTAYSILIERCAKFALHHGRKLRVYVERTGPNEDSKITQYHGGLLIDGMPFDDETSAKHSPLSAANLQSVLMKKPKFVSKDNPLIQLADLALYPLVRGKYDPDYPPYQHLIAHEKLLTIPIAGSVEFLDGVKYSCFDEEE
jgi:hypothetical protein